MTSHSSASVADVTSASAIDRGRSRQLLLIVVVVGVVLRVAPWLRAHTFLGVQESDDGVYYAAAKLLLNGLLPYSDYTIVHPPGVSLLLLPFAALGSVAGDDVGLASARVAIAIVAVANMLLVYRVALHLPSAPGRERLVALVAAGLYAVMPGAVIAERTVLLEPVVTLFGLLAVAALVTRPATRKTAFVAAVFCVLSVSVKLFACLYVIALLGWLVVSGHRQLLTSFLSGLVLASSVVLLPFFLVAPSEFWQNVVTTQASRPLDSTDTDVSRLVDMTGLASVGVVAGLVVLVALLSMAVVTWVRPVPAYTIWLFLGIAGVVAFSLAPSYFPHYGAFLAPSLALVGSQLLARPDGRAWVRRASLGAVGSAAAVYLLGSVVSVVESRGQDDFRVAGAMIEPGSCVFYELTSRVVAADVLALPTEGCPSWIDGRGVAYSWNTDWPSSRSFYPDGFVEDERWQAELQKQLRAADYLLLGDAPVDVPEWSAQTRAYAVANFALVLDLNGPGHARGQLWRRVTSG